MEMQDKPSVVAIEQTVAFRIEEVGSSPTLYCRAYQTGTPGHWKTIWVSACRGSGPTTFADFFAAAGVLDLAEEDFVLNGQDCLKGMLHPADQYPSDASYVYGVRVDWLALSYPES